MRTRQAGQAFQTLDTRTHSRMRRLRDAALVMFLASLISTAWLIGPVRPAAAQVSGGGNPVGISPQGGSPYPWEEGLRVSTYSVANLFNGNLLTAIPLLDPIQSVGPDLHFSIFHNSAPGASGIAVPSGAGFSIGEGWSVSYGGCIIDQTSNNPPRVYVLEDDGLLKHYAWNSSTNAATPPTGVYDKLEKVGSQWILTRKNQWQRVFDSSGLLVEHRDSHLLPLVTGGSPGIPTTFQRQANGKLSKITSAIGPEVKIFHYVDQSDDAPPTGRPPGVALVIKSGGLPYYYWYLAVDPTTKRVTSITYEHENNATILIEYDAQGQGRISAVTDKTGYRYAYQYDTSGRISTVTDPQSQTQTFTYSFVAPNKWKTVHEDRRGNDWSYTFFNWGGLYEVKNPAPFTAEKRTFGYDANRNRITLTNEVNKSWTATYDSMGNMLTMTNPLTQKWAFTYDSTYNNLLTVTPPLDSSGNTDSSKTVLLEYKDCTDPPTCGTYADRTHVTSIIEPDADGVGSDTAVTTLTWHQDTVAPGELSTVTDDNGVVTAFEYYAADPYGLPSLMRHEGLVTPLGADFRISEEFIYAGDGRVLSASGPLGSVNFVYDGIAPCPRTRTSLATTPTEAQCDPLRGFELDPPYTEDWPILDTACCSDVSKPECSVHLPGHNYCIQRCLDLMTHLKQELVPRRTFHAPGGVYDGAERFQQQERDELHHLTQWTVDSTLPVPESTGDLGPSMSRTFTLTPDANGRLDYLVDADGSATDYVYDEASRLKEIKVDGQSVVAYTLDATGRPSLANYVNGTATYWYYDDAGRMDVIEHKHSGTNLLTLDYHYTPVGLIDRIDESDASGTYVLNYGYDKRGRLIWENRMQGAVILHSFTYEYDQVGNRLTKTDHTGKVTTYYYDVHDPDWGDAGHALTFNNRLLRTETVQGATVLERVWYAYHRAGHVKRIVRNEPSGQNPNTYILTCMYYDSDQYLWLIRSTLTERDPKTAETTCELPLFAREFRYDSGGRRRYLVRERDASTLSPLTNGASWREYGSRSIFADLSVNSSNGDSTINRRYVHASDGRLLGWREGTSWHIIHADHLGSTRLVTTPTATVGSRLGYSAFGEILLSENPGGAASARSRYGYCGGWGYEDDGLADSTNDIGMLHIGARYYSPALGRFLQRDPIGVSGGLNVYAYAKNDANLWVDPRGTETLASTVSTAGTGQFLQTIALGAAAVGAGFAADRIATFIWTANVGYAADMLGITDQEMRKAIHKLKHACGVLGGNDDVEIDTETGEVRIRSTGEEIGNVGAEL